MNSTDALGVGGYITVDNRQLRITPLTPEDFALARERVRMLVPDPMEGIEARCNALHHEVAKVLIAKAYEAREKWGSLATEEGKAWAASPDGMAFFLYRQCLAYQPDIDLEWITAACKKMSMDVKSQLEAIMVRVSGLDRNPPSGATPRTNGKTAKKKQRKKTGR